MRLTKLRVFVFALLLSFLSLVPPTLPAGARGLVYNSHTVEPDGTIPFCFESGQAREFFAAIRKWETRSPYDFVRQCRGDTIHVRAVHARGEWAAEMTNDGRQLFLNLNSVWRRYFSDYCMYLHELGHAQKLDHDEVYLSTMPHRLGDQTCYPTWWDWHILRRFT